MLILMSAWSFDHVSPETVQPGLDQAKFKHKFGKELRLR